MKAKEQLLLAPKTVRECIDREIRYLRHRKEAARSKAEVNEYMVAQYAVQRIRQALFGKPLPPE